MSIDAYFHGGFNEIIGGQCLTSVAKDIADRSLASGCLGCLLMRLFSFHAVRKKVATMPQGRGLMSKENINNHSV
jgi:hypothetical protein